MLATDELNRAQRIIDAMEQQDKVFQESSAASIERRAKLDTAQFQTAEELQKLREDLEHIERQQGESERWSSIIAIATLVVSILTLAVTIIFGILQFLR